MKFAQKKNSSRFALALFVVLGFANFANASASSEAKKVADKMGATAVAEITFDQSAGGISDSAKKDLEHLINDAKQQGGVKEVDVVAWSDQEYPAKGTKVAPAQVDLAQQRADNVKTFLKNDLSVTDVTTVNMAKRPNSLQRLFKTRVAKEKKTMEKSGAAPTDDSQTGVFGLNGKASHAIILVYNH